MTDAARHGLGIGLRGGSGTLQERAPPSDARFNAAPSLAEDRKCLSYPSKRGALHHAIKPLIAVPLMLKRVDPRAPPCEGDPFTSARRVAPCRAFCVRGRGTIAAAAAFAT